MTKARRFFAETGQWTLLHIVALAIVLTGLFIMMTASAFGPMAPLVIATGAYFAVFGVICECLLAIRLTAKWIACRSQPSRQGK